MWIHDATEQAFKNGYSSGYEAGRRSSVGGDAVAVVRCKDCKWRREWISGGYFYCCNPNYGMASGVELRDDDFCSYGERIVEDGKTD